MHTSAVKPSWFKEAIVYQLLVDRFAGFKKTAGAHKPVFLGGNINGIAEKLPYLKDLGINTIWITPVQKTSAYHGYHITDFFALDRRFGTETDLKNMISQAHQLNIRVILDFVANHCSHQHAFFRHALQDKSSPYRKWFYFRPFTNTYLCFLHYHELPKLNLEYPAAREHIIEAARYLIGLGADGFRLDHVIGPSHGFWKAFGQSVRDINPEAVLIGEAWLEGISLGILRTISIRHKYRRWLLKFNPREIQKEYLNVFDGVLDFYFRHRVTEYIAWKEEHAGFNNKLRSAISEHYSQFPEGCFLPTFLDNHDMNRFLFDAGQNREKLKAALHFQFSLPQPPILYYGTETGLSHQEPVRWNVPFSDIHARQPMPWDSLDHELIGFCRELIWQRRKRQGLRSKMEDH